MWLQVVKMGRHQNRNHHGHNSTSVHNDGSASWCWSLEKLRKWFMCTNVRMYSLCQQGTRNLKGGSGSQGWATGWVEGEAKAGWGGGGRGSGTFSKAAVNVFVQVLGSGDGEVETKDLTGPV